MTPNHTVKTLIVHGEDSYIMSNAEAKALDTAIAKRPSRPTIIARMPVRRVRPIEAALFLVALGINPNRPVKEAS